MKVATLDLTPELFIDICKGFKSGLARKFVVKDNPLPDDAEIVRIGLANDGLVSPLILRLYIHSEAFAEVQEMKDAPALPRILFETVYETE